MSDTPMTREEVLAARKGYEEGYAEATYGDWRSAQRKAREAYPLPPLTRPREFEVGSWKWRWNGRLERFAKARYGDTWVTDTPDASGEINAIIANLLEHGPTETVPDPEDA